MNPEEFQAAATRLCAACGMCCDGVLFYGVRLQANDSSRRLTQLGLKIKRRDGHLHMLQPCTAHSGTACTVYSHRPTRCRLFECRQLKALAAGEINEQTAADRITEARRQVERVKHLLRQLGDDREQKSLTTRYETAFAPPLDPSPAAVTSREQLARAVYEMEQLLNREFRTEPGPSLPAECLSNADS